MIPLSDVLPKVKVVPKVSITYRLEENFKTMLEHISDTHDMTEVDTVKALIKREYDSLEASN